ncbi:MAG: DNA replication and repair protein RecF [Cyclobacteriaceae bacterium]
MILRHLELFFFKNYPKVVLDFQPGINCIVGKNGMGKTNLLDAIHYLCMTRSAINTIDSQNIFDGEKYFAINSRIEAEKNLRVNCYFEAGKKKIIKVNGAEVQRLSDHIGKIPCVLTTPDDNEIIKEGSEIRRKTFDAMISQSNRHYLGLIIHYSALLKQRNAFLKQNDGRLNLNRKLLETYDEQLLPLNKEIAQERAQFLAAFTPYFQRNYTAIFSGAEKVSIGYKSDCNKENFTQIFTASLEKDIVTQRTNVGCHKDDFVFRLNDKPVKKFGSQGQQKSFIIALKLSEYDFLKSIKENDPLLLLDDLFDKLDDERIAQIINLINDPDRFSQVFVTDARRDRSEELFKVTSNVHFFEIENGSVKNL